METRVAARSGKHKRFVDGAKKGHGSCGFSEPLFGTGPVAPPGPAYRCETDSSETASNVHHTCDGVCGGTLVNGAAKKGTDVASLLSLFLAPTGPAEPPGQAYPGL